MISRLKIYADGQIIPCLKNQVSLTSHLNKQNLVCSLLWVMKERFFLFLLLVQWSSGKLETAPWGSAKWRVYNYKGRLHSISELALAAE